MSNSNHRSGGGVGGRRRRAAAAICSLALLGMTTRQDSTSVHAFSITSTSSGSGSSSIWGRRDYSPTSLSSAAGGAALAATGRRRGAAAGGAKLMDTSGGGGGMGISPPPSSSSWGVAPPSTSSSSRRKIATRLGAAPSASGSSAPSGSTAPSPGKGRGKKRRRRPKTAGGGQRTSTTTARPRLKAMMTASSAPPPRSGSSRTKLTRSKASSSRSGGRNGAATRGRPRSPSPSHPSPSPPSSPSPSSKWRQHNSGTSGSWYQRDEMLRHPILTLDQDLDMGRKVQRGAELREALGRLAEDRRVAAEEEEEEEERRQRQRLQQERLGELELAFGERYYNDNDGSSSSWLGGDDADALLSDGGMFGGMEGMGMGMEGMGMGMGIDSVNNNDGLGALNGDIDASEITESAGFTILESATTAEAFASAAETDARHDSSRYILEREGSRFASDPIERDLRSVSDDDIIQILEVGGGRSELQHILSQGGDARNTLMSCNVRLVVSIAKKWMRNSAASFGPDGRSLVSLYAGGWDAPSLDEVVQEGILGLARAVDKYDPKRGLRFSTYATHWITNYVRLTFQNAKTGCIRVPYQLHDIKSRYRKLMKNHYDEGTAIPSVETVAETLGVTQNRLEVALRVTESLLSIDQPISSGTFKHKGSGAGVASEADILISDTLQCHEPKPEDHVELSFLRQCLENAMAAELSPHERDILRLRLGLDDGRSRTVREVVAVCGGGIRPSDVRSAERRAFKKLSSPNALHTYNLRDYLHMAGLEYDPSYRRR